MTTATLTINNVCDTSNFTSAPIGYCSPETEFSMLLYIGDPEKIKPLLVSCQLLSEGCWMSTTLGFDMYGLGEDYIEANADLISMMKDLYLELRKDAKLSHYLEEKLKKLSGLFSDENFDEKQ